MSYEIAEHGLVILGVLFMVVSLIKYYRRTQDKGLLKKIWFQKLDLTKVEYLLNRIGLYVLILGIIVRFMNHLLG
ncbi:hypothetical protein [Paremcibacter congregatus]|uniref:Uncharacterized protein n=1 Tax=Paremcibacter congregatus TaxID=2043170 RepID=A0A2G4YSD3_9PROT|nr:hypothetical protein [Paremcibacter congregatus]PHZ85203.1 hypothetical protein CRD36_07280 [Paremcibacter congregatus]QDE27863.1 hypothetical protein FIV45_11555 [Paremcibacter congregatus]